MIYWISHELFYKSLSGRDDEIWKLAINYSTLWEINYFCRIDLCYIETFEEAKFDIKHRFLDVFWVCKVSLWVLLRMKNTSDTWREAIFSSFHSVLASGFINICSSLYILLYRVTQLKIKFIFHFDFVLCNMKLKMLGICWIKIHNVRQILTFKMSSPSSMAMSRRPQNVFPKVFVNICEVTVWKSKDNSLS